MGFKKINSLKVSLFTHLVVALVFSIIFSFAVQNIAGHVKETIWLAGICRGYVRAKEKRI